ncbi:Hsp20/alpha crystallin family protein [Phaeodactylibacter xiamenensis]|jgi:HSP20 family protein|uniref:Hsp20/alpha crystallin family protein n=1 Tax=Phaeodactylibacter xiamenensis TaxID=1524460 RepID=UPI0024A8CDCF|nr:Hsp20/alpha crystallin family protein [Phaeodactylibacter xiamenensis]
MTLVTVKPNRTAAPSLFTDFDRVVNEVFGAAHRPVGTRTFKPAVNVIEREDNFVLQVAAPGLQKSDFEIELEKGLLTIKVERDCSAREGETIKRQEFGNYRFQRSFRLGKLIDTENVEATYEQGVLQVNLPKKEEARPKPARKIEIA